MQQGGRSLRPIAWILLLTLSILFVFYMICYTSNNWWVAPVSGAPYPPNNQTEPIKMGLFWMCIREHCLYDLSVDYMVVRYLPYKQIQQSYMNYRTVCMAIITIGMLFLCLALGFHFLFLSAFKFSHLVGFASGIAQIISGVVTLIGILIFIVTFKGDFGWSLIWMFVNVILIIINGVCVSILSSVILISRMRNMNISDFNQISKASF